MRTCPACGNHHEIRGNFCSQCGTRIANACTTCGFENLLNQSFCGECGKELISVSFLQEAKPLTVPASVMISAPHEQTAAPATNQINDDGESGSYNPIASDVVMEAETKPETEPVIDSIQVQQQSRSQAIFPSEHLAPEAFSSDLSVNAQPSTSQNIQSSQLDAQNPVRNYPELVQSLAAPAASPVLPAQADNDPLPYSPPVFGQFRALRQAMLPYEQLVPRLTQDIQAFISKKPQTSGQIILVSASDGLGKTTLIQQARNAADPVDPQTEEQALLWFGAQHYRCYAPNKILLQGWLDFLQNITGLSLEGGAPQPVQQYIQEFIQSLYQNQTPHPEMEGFLFDVFSAHDAKPLEMESLTHRHRFAEMMVEIIRQMSKIRPVALVLEDLHFADVATLDVLSHVVNSRLLHQAPVLLVLTCSREFYLAGPLEQAVQQSPYKEYVVGDLNDTQVEQFLNQGPLSGQVQAFPVSVLSALMEAGHGLPLFLEEVLRLFHQNGVVTQDSDSGKFMPGDIQRLHQLYIPNNFTELVSARLNALSPKERYVVQLASVLGERFAISLLLSLSQDSEAEFHQTLTTLYHQGLVTPDSAGTGRFRHGLIWRAIYSGIEPDLKSQLHQLVSQTLENDFNQEITVNPCLMAHHAEQGQLINRALSYWQLASLQMGNIGHLTATTHSMFRAVQLIHLLQTQILVEDQKETLNAQEDELYCKLGMLNSEQYPDLAISLLSRVIHRRKNDPDSSRQLQPYSILSRCYENKGSIVMALSSVDESLLLLDQYTYPLEYAVLLTTKVGYLYQLGRFAQARELIEKFIVPTFTSYSMEEDPEYFKTYLNARLFLADILIWQGDRGGLAVYDQCLALAQEKNIAGLSLVTQLSKTRAYLKLGEYQRCDQEADHLLAQIEALDEPDWFLAQWGLLAMEYHLCVGDWESARQLMLTVISRADSVHDFHTSILAQMYGAYIAHQFGQTEKARPMLEQAIDASQQYRFIHCTLQGWLYLSEMLLKLDMPQEAQQVAERGLQLSQLPEVQNRWYTYQMTCMLSRAMIAVGQLKDAGKMLERIWPDLISMQFTPLVAEAATCIGTLYKNLATQTPSEISKQHLLKSIQFFQKAQGLWLDLNNKHQVNRIRSAMPSL